MGQIEISRNTDIIEHHQQLFKQTYTLLELYRSEALTNPKFAREYLGDETMGFLRKALQGAETAYHRRNRTPSPSEEALVEAADIAYVVFAIMHDVLTSPLLPMGFSEHGMLEAPQDPSSFRRQVRSMQSHLGLVVQGQADKPKSTEEAIAWLRTRSFFHAGSILPLHIPRTDDERTEYLNRLLHGIDTNLGNAH